MLNDIFNKFKSYNFDKNTYYYTYGRLKKGT